MRMGKRVTLGTLGLLLASAATLAVAGTSCEPSHDPNYAGPPFVAQVIAYDVNDPGTYTNLYVANDPACDYDLSAGSGDLGATIPGYFSFRILMSELIQPDEVEAVDENDIGVENGVFPGLVEITNPDGTPVTSTIPGSTLTITADDVISSWNPANGNGCHGQFFGIDYYTGGPNAGPAFMTTLSPTLPGFPSNTQLKLWLRAKAGDHDVVDYGGTPLRGTDGSDFSVTFTTEPMNVDCYSPDTCATVPSLLADDQPVAAPPRIMVTFTAIVGDPSGVLLYEQGGTAVAGVTAAIDADVADSMTMDPYIVDLIGGTADAPTDLTLTAGTTYWIVVTDGVLDAWGVPVEAFDTSCDNATAAGVTVTGCVWAGTFTVSP